MIGDHWNSCMTATCQKQPHVYGDGESALERRHLQDVEGDSCGRNHQTPVAEPGDSLVARKFLKADREKLRRDRLNEQFLELGNVLDADRPKNDKATILADTIQVLKDLTSQVNRLKAEYSSLSEESRELTQEKNDLKEEKAILKSDVDTLNIQHQQRVRGMYPWSTIDPSIMIGQALAPPPPPPPYPYAVPVTIPSVQVPLHPPVHQYPFFPSTCSPFLPYYAPCNTRVEEATINCPCVSSNPPPHNNLIHTPSSEESRNKQNSTRIADDDVATELELKTPGSAAFSCCGSTNDKKRAKGTNKRMWEPEIKRKTSEGESSSNRCETSSHSLLDCSSDSVGDGSVAEN